MFGASNSFIVGFGKVFDLSISISVCTVPFDALAGHSDVFHAALVVLSFICGIQSLFNFVGLHKAVYGQNERIMTRCREHAQSAY